MNAREPDSTEVPPVKSPEEELLNLLATQSRRLPIPVFAVLAVIGGLIYPHSPNHGWAVWLGVVLLVLGLRYAVLVRLPDMDQLALSTRVNIAALMSGINGIAHSSSLIFFSDLSDIERAIQSLILAGLATAAIATTAGNSRIYLAYFLPIFPTMVLLWATNGTWSVPTRTDLGLAFSVTVFAVVLLMLARDTQRQFIAAIKIRKEQEELNTRLQQALQDAAVADRAKTRFLASASHDLRQPIHALSLFAAALKMQDLPPKLVDLADNINESVVVLASQLDALLDISRLDAGVVRPEMGVVDLASMLRRVAREIEPEATAKALSLHLDIAAQCQVVTDKLLLERVIRNLLNNAIRYTEQGSIGISTRIGAKCVLAIEDTGIGIPRSEQKKIFNEFYQVSQQYGSSKQGLGLGLSIVMRLLALLEAPLTLSSTPGEGTRVEIALELEREGTEAPDGIEMAGLDGVHILVIDDDASVRTAMNTLLFNFGALVATAANIQQALACVGQQTPDIILSDLRLGRETGIEAIAQIREAVGDVPAILITGDTSTEQIQQAERIGYDLLHKPVNPAELEKRITEVMRRGL